MLTLFKPERKNMKKIISFSLFLLLGLVLTAPVVNADLTQTTSSPPATDSSTADVVIPSVPSQPPPATPTLPSIQYSAPVFTPGSSNQTTQATQVHQALFSRTAPVAVVNLTVMRVGSKSVDLAWNAPYSVNSLVGFDLRMSRSYITEANWNDTIQVPGGGQAVVAGAKVMATADQLPEATKLYFAIKIMDTAGLVSGLSNVVSATTGGKLDNVQDIFDRSASPARNNPVVVIHTGDLIGGMAKLSLTVLMPDGTTPVVPIFVNFVNGQTQVSYGGSLVFGHGSFEVPPGSYYTKLIVLDPLLTAPLLPNFSLQGGEQQDLGTVILGQNTGDSEVDAVASSVGNNTGTALAYIIKLLGRILLLLEQLVAKLGATNPGSASVQPLLPYVRPTDSKPIQPPSNTNITPPSTAPTNTDNVLPVVSVPTVFVPTSQTPPASADTTITNTTEANSPPDLTRTNSSI